MAAPANIQAVQGPAQQFQGGTPASASVLGFEVPSDEFIRGALKINPAFAGDFLSARYGVNPVVPGGQEPVGPIPRLESQTLATENSPNAWKKRTLPAMSDAVLFGSNPPQPPPVTPWQKKFIPPLALFNDASQWVNRLMFHRPMTWFGADTSDLPLRAQYFTPPPINTNNLAGGTLNLQLQLGQMAIQAEQLTVSASTYYG
jgi:hypothetical protein